MVEPPTLRAAPRAPRDRKSFVDVFSDEFADRVAQRTTTDSHDDADFRRHFRRQRAHVAHASLLRERDRLARLSRAARDRADEIAAKTKTKARKRTKT
jgi:hypothetical protein